MKDAALFTARIVREGKWFLAFSPGYPEGKGQGLTEDVAVNSLRESIILLMEDRREDARASLRNGEKLIPLFPAVSTTTNIFDEILAGLGWPTLENFDDTAEGYLPPEKRNSNISQNSYELGKASAFANSFTIKQTADGQSQVFYDGQPVSHPMSSVDAREEMKALQGLEFSPMRVTNTAIREARKRHNLSPEEARELGFATDDIQELLEEIAPTERRAFIVRAIDQWAKEKCDSEKA